MKAPRVLPSILAFLLLASRALAGSPDPRDAQVDAATADAVCRLRTDIESQALTPDLTVGTFVQRTGDAEQWNQSLRKADQIGGPRWIDNDICQVKLAIASDRVRQTLAQIATDNPKTAPLPPEAILAKLKIWDNRTFTATGSSISATRAEQLKPTDLPATWRGVSEDARKQAVRDARENAILRVIDSIKPIEITPGKTVADVARDKSISDLLWKWLTARPVTRLEFRSDLSVEITLAASPRDLFGAFRDAVAATPDLLPTDQIGLAKLRRQFADQMATPVGSARIGSVRINSDPRIASPIPDRPPQWITKPIMSEATTKPVGSALKTNRAAQSAALDALRTKIDPLQLGSTTIGEAAKQSASVRHAIDTALSRAKPYKVEYLPDGSVTVKTSLDPRDLWDELRELP